MQFGGNDIGWVDFKDHLKLVHFYINFLSFFYILLNFILFVPKLMQASEATKNDLIRVSLNNLGKKKQTLKT